jgi:hypothetical protein
MARADRMSVGSVQVRSRRRSLTRARPAVLQWGAAVGGSQMWATMGSGLFHRSRNDAAEPTRPYVEPSRVQYGERLCQNGYFGRASLGLDAMGLPI